METSIKDKIEDGFGSTTDNPNVVKMEEIVRRIVKEKTGEVTDIVHKIRTYLKDETTELSDVEIDDILLQLPLVLYDGIEEQEIVGLELDLASQILKEAQSEAYNLARGTIKDKEALSDLKTRTEQLEKIIYDRSYKIIKQKFEMAVETLNAVKKVQASRQQKYELGKYRNNF